MKTQSQQLANPMSDSLGDYEVEEDERSIEETENRGDDVPMTLIVPMGDIEAQGNDVPMTLIVPLGDKPARSDDVRRFIARLESMSYGVHKGTQNEYQTVYAVTPPQQSDDGPGLITRLYEMNYAIHMEYQNEHQAVHTVRPLAPED